MLTSQYNGPAARGRWSAAVLAVVAMLSALLLVVVPGEADGAPPAPC